MLPLSRLFKSLFKLSVVLLVVVSLFMLARALLYHCPDVDRDGFSQNTASQGNCTCLPINVSVAAVATETTPLSAFTAPAPTVASTYYSATWQPTLSATRLFPRIFIYEPPVHLLSPLFDGRRHLASWDSLEYYVWKALQAYEGRVHNPDEADLFFIPHITTILYHDNSYNTSLCAHHLLGILHYVVHELPYFNRSSGLDHVVAFAHDAYSIVLQSPRDRAAIPLAFRKNVIKIINQGDDNSAYDGDFNVHRDIVTLPMARDVQFIWRKKQLVRKPWAMRRWLGYFRGSILPDQPAYSRNIRQRMIQHYKNDSVIFFHEAAPSSYDNELLEAKFCIYVRGWFVWSERLGVLVSAGCIPVIIADNYYLPYSDVLDWRTFSIRVRESNCLELHKILGSITEQRAAELEANLQVAAQKLAYHLPPGPDDIFPLILHELRRRASPLAPFNNGEWF